MCVIEVIRREKKKNKKLQAKLEQMITNLKVQIEEDKRIEETLKAQLEVRDMIIGNLEVDIVTSKKLGSITQSFMLSGFLQGLTSMTTNLNQQLFEKIL